MSVYDNSFFEMIDSALDYAKKHNDLKKIEDLLKINKKKKLNSPKKSKKKS